jgi:hypothetical protein
MAASGSKKALLSQEAQTRLPTPDEALNIAHAFHASGDQDLSGSPTQRLCADIVESFLKLKPRRNNNAEEAYLNDAVKPIVHSYARAITQRKRKYREALEEAARVRSEKENRLNGGQLSKQGISVIWKIVGPFILPVAFGLLGYMLAKLIGQSDLVPNNVASTTGPSLPSIALSLFFAWIGRLVSVWANNRARDRIKHEYDKRRSAADSAYELGKIEEFKLAHAKLCEAWRQYTGRSYRKTINYQAVMEGDQAFKRGIDEYISKINQPLTYRVRELSTDVRSAFSKFRRRKEPQLPSGEAA